MAKRRRSQREIDRLASDFMGRLDWLETAWGAKTEGEVDLETGKAWFKVTMPGTISGLRVECDAAGLTITDSPAT